VLVGGPAVVVVVLPAGLEGAAVVGAGVVWRGREMVTDSDRVVVGTMVEGELVAVTVGEDVATRVPVIVCVDVIAFDRLSDAVGCDACVSVRVAGLVQETEGVRLAVCVPDIVFDAQIRPFPATWKRFGHLPQ
jgi:hypothetical protein